LLTPDRLGSEAFHAQLRSALRGQSIDSIVSCYTDFAVADLAREMGITSALPGWRFSAENGDALINSKAVFRAVAAGIGLPIAPGVVTGSREHAELTINAILDEGHGVMVKREFAGGGFGNELLCRTEGARLAGAPNIAVLPDAAAVASYLGQRWSWLTGGRNDRLVIERYFADAVTVYAEFDATDEGCVLRGTGEILMEPVAVGEIIPPQSITGDKRSELVELARRICEQVRDMGYRGNICADAIVVPGGDIVFTETNGRLTASTHLHHNLIGHVVGPRYKGERVFLERAGLLTASSYPEAIEQLDASGLGYDPATRLGVVLTANYVPINGKITYCVVAEDLQAARSVEAKLLAAVGSPAR
jgi:biotin carboxylase